MALTDSARAALEAPNFWHLATVNPDGSPQVTPVWVHTKGDRITVNSALGRKKTRNMQRSPKVALSWVDPANPYHTISVQGTVVDSHTGPSAEAEIDSLANKYIGEDVYPWRSEGEQRIGFEIEAGHVTAMGE
jgi:PPOX class probable F420-dependent enzyme